MVKQQLFDFCSGKIRSRRVDYQSLRLRINQYIEVFERNRAHQHLICTWQDESAASGTPVLEMEIDRSYDFARTVRTIGKFDFPCFYGL